MKRWTARLACLLIWTGVGGCKDAEGPVQEVDMEVRRLGDASLIPTDPADQGPSVIVDCESGETRPCGSDVGTCTIGYERCLSGLWTGFCEESISPIEERCDGLDNDCDGSSDESFSLGIDCDFVDENGDTRVGAFACNMETGEVFCAQGVECETDADEDGAGVCEDCDDTNPGNFPGNPETCDGQDNDCDDRIDEAFPVGRSCTVGLGICRRGGTLVCPPADMEGVDVVCQGEPAPPEAEICDGLDNDCDGEVDEGFSLGMACRLGIGTCESDGVMECALDGTSTCVGETQSPVLERCNGLDDDCDTRTDEGFDLGSECSVGVGACVQRGQLACGDDESVVCSAVPSMPGEEQCNNIDDDCDGLLDEGNPGGGQGCNTGEQGVCGPGVENCREGEIVCDRIQSPGAELCNDVDDDCDGTVDEAPGVGVACEVGVGACRRVGARVCDETGAVACDAVPGPAGIETCNGIDDDCDGFADERDPGGGEACATGLSGICGPGRFSCVDGGLVCVPTFPPEREVCNGEDDDCDGNLDNVEGVGDPCAVGIGACRREGGKVCGDASLTCGVVPGDPTAETCNLIDDDCDGRSDEGNPGAGEACETGEPGICNAGLTSCDEESGSVCLPTRAPEPESCNGLDDDCDGEVDEVPGVGDPCAQGIGACRATGVKRCGDEGFVVCGAVPLQPGDELCEGTDEDCDGRIDEGYALREICEIGDGLCLRRGLTICSEDGLGVSCDGTPGDAVEEACNGFDDDCDGQSDEGEPESGAECDTGEPGVCAAGTVHCAQGALACQRVGVPSAELCDNIDQDCDEEVDETFPLGEPCEAGVGACRRAGSLVCADDGAGVQCDTVAAEPRVEECNQIDDDCDGRVDEELGLGEACEVGLGICRRLGTQICARDGSVACDAVIAAPRDETCDGLDEDCDGSVDEGNPGGGGECETGTPGVCAAGQWSCIERALVCVPRVAASEEVCNGLDDDCDRVADENAGGEECDTGQSGLCGIGATECRRGVLICNRRTDPGPETCDDFDNDCDGETDEDFEGLGEACDDDDADQCAYGVLQCDAESGAAVCVEDTDSPEVCNAADDDCDGVPDNGIDLFTDIENCGECGNVCGGPRPQCVLGVCYRTYNVSQSTGSDATGNGSVEAPWRSLTHALDVVPAGGDRARIYVAPGRYAHDSHPTEGEVFPIQMRDRVQLVGVVECDPEPCVRPVIDGGLLDSPQARPGGGTLMSLIDMPDPQNLLANFIIRNGGEGRTDSTVLVSTTADLIEQGLRSRVTLRGSRIESVTSRNAFSALAVYNTDVVLQDSEVWNSIASGARSLVLISSSTLEMDGCHFQGNNLGEPEAYGMIRLSGSEFEIYNSVFTNNFGNGIMVDADSAGLIVHNSFANVQGKGISILSSDNVIVANNAFAGHTEYALIVPRPVENLLVVSNIFFENFEGQDWPSPSTDGVENIHSVEALEAKPWAFGNFEVDPAFFSPFAGNLRLRDGSPAVDRADPDYSVPADQDGNPRPRGQRADIGAFESVFDP